jgi:hypothetical protein
MENILGLIFFGIILFIILREFFCWYYKINAIKTIMEEQRDIMMEQNKLLKTMVFLEKSKGANK